MSAFLERDPFFFADGSNLQSFLSYSIPNAVDASGTVVSYRVGAEPLRDSHKTVKGLRPGSWLAIQDWSIGLSDHVRGRVPTERPWHQYVSSANVAFIGFSQDTDFPFVQMLRNNWIADRSIRFPMTALTRHSHKNLMLIVGNWAAEPSTTTERNANIALQQMRIAQLMVIFEFLNAVGDDGLDIKEETGGERFFKWGDPFVSRAAVLGTKFVIENFNNFRGIGNSRHAAVGALLQSFVVNSQDSNGYGDFNSAVDALSLFEKTGMDIIFEKISTSTPKLRLDKMGTMLSGKPDIDFTEKSVVRRVDGRAYLRSEVEFSINGHPGSGSFYLYSRK